MCVCVCVCVVSSYLSIDIYIYMCVFGLIRTNKQNKQKCVGTLYTTLQAVTDAHGVDAHGVGANSAQPHGLG